MKIDTASVIMGNKKLTLGKTETEETTKVRGKMQQNGGEECFAEMLDAFTQMPIKEKNSRQLLELGEEATLNLEINKESSEEDLETVLLLNNVIPEFVVYYTNKKETVAVETNQNISSVKNDESNMEIEYMKEDNSVSEVEGINNAIKANGSKDFTIINSEGSEVQDNVVSKVEGTNSTVKVSESKSLTIKNTEGGVVKEGDVSGNIKNEKSDFNVVFKYKSESNNMRKNSIVNTSEVLSAEKTNLNSDKSVEGLISKNHTMKKDSDDIIFKEELSNTNQKEKSDLQLIKNKNITSNKQQKNDDKDSSIKDSYKPFELTENKLGVKEKADSTISQEKIYDQIVDKFDFTLKNDKNVLTIELKPDSLGKVSVQIEMGKKGMEAKIITDNAYVKEALTLKVNELAKSLENYGIKEEAIHIVDNTSVQYEETTSFLANGSESDFLQYSKDQNNGNNQEKMIDFEEVENEIEEMSTYESGINVYV